MEKETTIEQKTAQTILQQPVEVAVGEKKYAVAPPSTATLILASAAVSRLPKIHLDEERVMEETLANAKDCAGIGEVLAILILGAKHADDMVVSKEKVRKPILWGLFHRTQTIETIETKKDVLAREILLELSPRELQNAFARVIKEMQIGDFFGLTTFLLEVNVTRATKVEEPTASGQ